jgi:hypothetical protein
MTGRACGGRCPLWRLGCLVSADTRICALHGRRESKPRTRLPEIATPVYGILKSGADFAQILSMHCCTNPLYIALPAFTLANILKTGNAPIIHASNLY